LRVEGILRARGIGRLQAGTGQAHYLRVHIAHLRKKLGDTEGDCQMIRTESAVGYRFVAKE
jgi:DNA-binding response OmpR family regulator